jgi:hypothetical protein
LFARERQTCHTVIPAKAGSIFKHASRDEFRKEFKMDSRLRGNDPAALSLHHKT